MKTKEVIDYLDSQFLPKYQESYDNAGFLVGDPESEYTGTLITLDVTPDSIDEAIDNGLSLIVSHHPLIFNGLKRIINNDTTGRMVTKLIQNNISVYSAHTNLDNLDWGVNGILAQKLGLTNCRILRPNNSQFSILNSQPSALSPQPSALSPQLSALSPQPSIGAGMIGSLPSPMPLTSFLKMVKATLNLPILRTSQLSALSPQPSALTVAICGGSGSFLINDAKNAGADIYMTGDLKYHDFQQAEDKIILVDIGHYESEQFAKEIFYHVISEKFSTFACRISEQSKSYIEYI